MRYVKGRRQFGRPVGGFQALSHGLADLATEIEATRLLTYDVAQAPRREPWKAAATRSFHGQGQGNRTCQAGRDEGSADDGRLRSFGRVWHGGTRPCRDCRHSSRRQSEVQRDVIAKLLGL
ncbi:MAG: hypothetical protein EKK51_18020 [Mycolicibacterium sp.]|nr:MAG: hypothetical protein EKK51_18020 [Mycolicibacterium sp.]